MSLSLLQSCSSLADSLLIRRCFWESQREIAGVGSKERMSFAFIEMTSRVLRVSWDIDDRSEDYTLFFYKNHAYKNVEAQITPKIKNIVVILLVAISISFPASDEIKTFL